MILHQFWARLRSDQDHQFRNCYEIEIKIRLLSYTQRITIIQQQPRAGPYAQTLLGISSRLAAEYEGVLLDGMELLKPGFTRLNLPWFASDDEVDFVLEAVALTCESAWKIMPQYRGVQYHIPVVDHLKVCPWETGTEHFFTLKLGRI